MKLREALLDILNESNLDSTNWTIASTVLKLGPDLEHTSSKQLADKCHVSEPTISRFVKKLGFSNYSNLKKSAHLIREPNNAQMFHTPKESLDVLKKKPDLYLKDYQEKINDSLRDLISVIDYEQIDIFLKRIYESKRVFIFSCSYSLMLGEVIQSNLANYGKLVVMGLNEAQQLELIDYIDKDDLVISISVFGNYIHEFPEITRKIAATKGFKVLLTQNFGFQETYYFDQVFCFSKKNHNEAGFYSMFFITEYLTRRYAMLFNTER